MRRIHWLITVGVVAWALVASPGLTASTVEAPPAQYQEGQLVQGPDGSLFVYEGGQLHRIQPVQSTADQISATPLGSPVTRGVMIIPEPATPVAAPAPTGPPWSGEAFGVRLTVLEVQRPFSSNVRPRPGYEWMVFRLHQENLQSSPLFAVGTLFLEDASGSVIGPEDGGRPPVVPPAFPTFGMVGQFGERRGNVAVGVPIGVAIVKMIWVLQENPRQAIEVLLQ